MNSDVPYFRKEPTILNEAVHKELSSMKFGDKWRMSMEVRHFVWLARTVVNEVHGPVHNWQPYTKTLHCMFLVDPAVKLAWPGHEGHVAEAMAKAAYLEYLYDEHMGPARVVHSAINDIGEQYTCE